MAIVTVSGLPSSSGKKNEVRDSIENLLADLALGDDSSLRQHTPLYAKLSVNDEVVQASQVLALNDLVLGLDRKISFSIALAKTVEGSLDDVAALYATKKTIAGLGNEAVVLTDSDLSTTALRDLDKKTSGVIDVAALDSLSGSLVDMTAVLKSKGIGGLANATLVLEQDAPLTAKNLKALTALATQAGTLENVDVDVSGALTTLEGTFKDVSAVLTAEGLTGLNGIDVTITDTKLTTEALAALTALTDGSITASKLKTLTGDAASVAALVDAGVEGIGSTNITLSDEALDVAELNALLAATTGKITAKLKSLSGSLEDIAAAKQTIGGLGKEAIQLTDSELFAADLRALDSRTSGVINVAELGTLSGSLVDMTAVLKSKGIAGLANATLVLEQDAPLAAKDLKALTALASQAASLDNVSVEVSAVLDVLEGTLKDVSAVLTAEGLSGLDSIDVSLTDTKLTTEALAGLTALTDGSVTAGKLKTLNGDAASVVALYEANVEGLDSVNITLSDASLDAAELNAILAATTGKITASKLKTLSGSLEDILQALDTPTTQIAGLASKAIILGDNELDASQLLELNALSKGLIDAGNLSLLTGSAADIRTALTTSVREISGLGSQNVSVDDDASVAELNSIDAATSGMVSASISGSAATLVGLNTGDNEYAITITDAASLAQLTQIAAATSLDLDYSAIRDSAATLVGDGSEPSEWLAGDVTVSVIDTATPAQLDAIAAAIGGGELNYSALTGSAEELIGDGSEPSNWLADGVTVNLTGSATIGQLDAIAAIIGEAALTYLSVSGSAADLAGDGSAASPRLIEGVSVTVTDTATPAQLDAIAGAIGDGELSYSALVGSAEELVGDGSEPSVWLVDGLTVTVTGVISDAQLQAISAAIGTGILTHGQVSIPIVDGMDFSAGNNGVILTGSDGDQSATGSIYDDIMNGGAGNDTLRGNAGDDTLYGGTGADTLFGGLGNDLLYGGDDETGDAEQDSFLYLAGFGQGDDTIVGFEPGVDRIILSGGNFADVQISDEGADAIITLTHTNADVTTIRLLDRAGQINTTDIVTLGTPGDDTFNGTVGDDVLSGQGGNDTLYGLAGDDVLFGGAGDDALHGGEGNDILYGGAGGDTLIGGLGDDIMFGGDGGDNVAPDGAQNLFVYHPVIGQGNDTIYGFQPGLDRILLAGGPVTDIQISNQGADAVITLTHPTTQITTITLVNRAGRVDLTDIIIIGTAGNDVLQGNAGNNVISGLEGNDTIDGGAGSDSLYGGLGDDILIGGGSDAANAGYDAFLYDHRFGQGNDTITDFNPGRDKIALVGGAAQIQIGTDGADALITLIHPNDETTTIRLPDLAGQITRADFSITGNSANDTLFGDGEDNILAGFGGDDTLHGLDGHDTLYGGAGNDTLYGGAGNDTLYGGTGNDTLIGGLGNDTLTGGTVNEGGYNAFLYEHHYGQDQDTITDFVPGRDKIVLMGGAAKHIQIDTDGADAMVTITHSDDQLTQIRVLDQAELITLADFSISGRAGDDLLIGSDGRDVILGQAGEDEIIGMGGGDVLYGGADSDTFIYLQASDSVFVTGFIDLIMDFELGPEGDVIDLTALNLDSTSYSWSTAATTLAASQSASAAFAAGHGIHAVVIGDDTYLFADADGSQVMAAGDLAIRLVGFTDAQTLALHLEA